MAMSLSPSRITDLERRLQKYELDSEVNTLDATLKIKVDTEIVDGQYTGQSIVEESGLTLKERKLLERKISKGGVGISINIVDDDEIDDNGVPISVYSSDDIQELYSAYDRVQQRMTALTYIRNTNGSLSDIQQEEMNQLVSDLGELIAVLM